MASRAGTITVLILLSASLGFGQQDVIRAIEEAKGFYLAKQIAQAANALSTALDLVNKEIIAQVESVFPEPLKEWRRDLPLSRITPTAYTTSVVSKCRYFKHGGGQSVEIEIQTNAPRIANIRMAFANPAMVKQLGDGARIVTVSDYSAIERYDGVDRFAELMLVPTPSVLITVRGYEMKDAQVVAKFAEKFNWKLIEQLFP